MKNLKKLGKVLGKQEQKSVSGGQGQSGWYVCDPSAITICRFKSMCKQNLKGDWYCSIF